jgi:cellulose synthase/poly-beta-1,6-N-acetylglucosamine synthase-like glycosyltransferase
VTLVVAVPMLVAALILSIRGSHRATLIWLAMLNFMLYNYAFYLFGAAFNWFFLIYVLLFTLSIFALIFGLLNIDVNRISGRFQERTPVKWISGYLLFVAIGLSIIYISQSLAFVATGQLPEIVLKSGHPTSVIFALDLSLLVPVFTLGAIWLWKRRPWGYVLATMSAVKGATYTLVLTVVSLWGANAGVPGALEELPLWLFLTLAGLVASLFLLGNLKSGSLQSHKVSLAETGD